MTQPLYDFEKALQGDEREQLRSIIYGLALLVQQLAMLMPEGVIRESSQAQATAATDYLRDTAPK